MRLFNRPSSVVWLIFLITIAGSLTDIVKSQEEAAAAKDEAPAESPNNAPADAVVAPADSDPAQKSDAEEAAGTTDGDPPSEANQDGDVPANSPPAEDDQSSKPDEEVPAQSQGEAAPPQEIAPPASEDGGVADLQPEKDSAAPEPEVASVEPVGQSDVAAEPEPEPTKSTVVESAGDNSDNSESNDAATTTVSANENVAPGVPGVPGGETGTPLSEEERAAIDSTNGGDVPADTDASESKEPSASAEAETSPNADEQPSADSTTPESVHETVSVSEADDAGRLPDDSGLPIEAPAAETTTSNDGSAIQVDGEQDADHTKVTESIESHSPEETVDREDEAMSGTGAGGNEPVIDSASTTTSDGSIVSPTAADSEETPSSSSTAAAVVEEIIIPRTVLPLQLETSPMSGTGAGGNEPVIDSASTTTSDGSIVSPTAADSEETPSSSSTAAAVVEEIIIPRTVLPLQLENSPETSSSISGSTGITSQPETMPVAETTVVVIATDVVTTDSRTADAVGGESAVDVVQLTTVMRTVSTDEPTSAPVNLSVVTTVEVPLVTAKIELKQYQRTEHDGKAVAIDIPLEKKNDKELNKLRRAIARAILRARRKANKTISSAVPNEVTLVPVNATDSSVNEVTSHVPRVTDNSEPAAAAGGASVATDVANTGDKGDNNMASRPRSDGEDRVTAEMITATSDEETFVPKLRLRRDVTDDESEDDEFSEDELKQAEEEVEFVVGSDGTVAIVANGMNADQLAQVLEEYKNEIAAESDVSISINPSGATALEANESEQPVSTPSVWDVHFPLFLTIIILALLVILLTVVCCLCARCRNRDESAEKTPVSMEECRPVRHQMTASNPISDDEIVRDEATPMQECPNPSLPRNGGGQHISKHDDDDDDAWESGVMPLEDYIGTYQNSSVFENTRL